jgi:hypothetical protein
MPENTTERPRPSIFAQTAGGLLGAILIGTIEDNTQK